MVKRKMKVLILALVFTVFGMAVSVDIQTSAAWDDTQKKIQEKIQEETADVTISSERELLEFALSVNNGNSYEGKLIKLTQDIKLDGTANKFTPIGNDDGNAFQGTFDGEGHTISGIDVMDINGECYCTGLFGWIDYNGKVCNVTVKSCEFTSQGSVGGIAGVNLGIIDNCHNRETRVGTDGDIGGIAGDNCGTILNCSSTGTVTGTGSQGGIAGNNSSGKIYNCCNLGEVINQSEYEAYVGGIIGEDGTLYYGEIQNCYNVGRISVVSDSETIYHGGIAGSARGIVARSYCSEESDERTFSVKGAGIKNTVKALPESEMNTESFVEQLNENRGSNAGWLEWEIRTEEGILYPLQVKRANLSLEGRCNISIATGGSLTYDGTKKQPKITVIYDGKTLGKDIDYEITYLNNVNAGTAQAVVTGINNYMGTCSKEFTIRKADRGIKIAASVYKKTCGDKPFYLLKNASQIKEKLGCISSDSSVAVADSKGRVILKGTGKTVITVSVPGTQNYNPCSGKVTIFVSPKKQEIKVKILSKRKMKVSWKKDSKATGYEIQYSLDKSFKKGTKTVVINKAKTTSTTLKNLTKGKRYYVRVRTYKKIKGSKDKLLGKWSSTKRSGAVKK